MAQSTTPERPFEFVAYRISPEAKHTLMELAKEDCRSITEEIIWLIQQEAKRRQRRKGRA